VGYGSIRNTFHEEAPFFADDLRTISEWPLRFNFEILWPTPLDPFNGPWVSIKGIVEGRTLKKFHKLGLKKAEELLRRCQAAPG
jgi:hypothetical protein